MNKLPKEIKLYVSLTSGLPMSLQNGRASLQHFPPPSPKSRKAGKPDGRSEADWAY